MKLKRNQIKSKTKNCFRYFLISLLPTLAQADEPLATNNLDIFKPAISIIIDDMGYRLNYGNRAINLPGALAYSFLPHAPHVKTLSQRAHDQNKEVMLHLPMEAEGGKKLGPGGLTECMTQEKFATVFKSNINSIPYVSGFNNHMGSLLTKSALWMKRLMREAGVERKLFFVDSKTTSNSVALKVARAEGLQSIQRDIFIDHDPSPVMIQKQLKKLIKRAQRKGTALAIAHPKKTTLAVLEKWLPELERKGILLIPVAKLITLQQQRRLALWQNPALP